MNFVARRLDGLYFRLNGHKSSWTLNIVDATVFANKAAYNQCIRIGRLAHLEPTVPVEISTGETK
jgi:hypothetical protein